MMYKIVNGEQVEMSQEEEAEILKQWEENSPESVKNKAIAAAEKAQQYLNDTDYLVLRASGEGYTLSEDVKESREQARQAIRAARNIGK